MSDEPNYDIHAVALEYGIPVRWVWVVEYYMQTLNQTKAARMAGFSTPHIDGNRIVNDARVKPLLEKRYREVISTTNEVLARVSMRAKTDLADYINPKTGEIDINGLVTSGATIAVKKYKVKTRRSLKDDTIEIDTEIELYDGLRADELLGRHLKLWGDVQAPRDEPDVADLPDGKLRDLAKSALARGEIDPDDVLGLTDASDNE